MFIEKKPIKKGQYKGGRLEAANHVCLEHLIIQNRYSLCWHIFPAYTMMRVQPLYACRGLPHPTSSTFGAVRKLLQLGLHDKQGQLCGQKYESQ